MKKKIKETKIRVFELKKNGVLRSSNQVIQAGLIGGRYLYKRENVFYTRPYGMLLPPSFIVPTVLVRDGVVESYAIWDTTPGKIMDAEEFSTVIQNSAFAIYQLLKESEKNFEILMMALSAASIILLLYLIAMLGGFG